MSLYETDSSAQYAQLTVKDPDAQDVSIDGHCERIARRNALRAEDAHQRDA